jgi:small-conductance mechanosensitive channel
MRLDDLSSNLLDWLDKEFKIIPGYWKDPVVSIKSFNGESIQLELWYYVDNIRLEQDGRSRRVRSELSRLIREKFVQEGIW